MDYHGLPVPSTNTCTCIQSYPCIVHGHVCIHDMYMYNRALLHFMMYFGFSLGAYVTQHSNNSISRGPEVHVFLVRHKKYARGVGVPVVSVAQVTSNRIEWQASLVAAPAHLQKVVPENVGRHRSRSPRRDPAFCCATCRAVV